MDQVNKEQKPFTGKRSIRNKVTDVIKSQNTTSMQNPDENQNNFPQ